jgi:hypothetical protein
VNGNAYAWSEVVRCWAFLGQAWRGAVSGGGNVKDNVVSPRGYCGVHGLQYVDTVGESNAILEDLYLRGADSGQVCHGRA